MEKKVIIKPWQGGVLAFFVFFSFIFILGIFFGVSLDKHMYLVLGSDIFFSFWFSFSVALIMYRNRNWTITIPFTDKEYFNNKLNKLHFLIKNESKIDNFYVYKNSYDWYKITVTFNEKEAIIIGPKSTLDRLQKQFNKK